MDLTVQNVKVCLVVYGQGLLCVGLVAGVAHFANGGDLSFEFSGVEAYTMLVAQYVFVYYGGDPVQLDIEEQVCHLCWTGS